METERRYELIAGVGEEVVTKDELMQLLDGKKHPVAYDGFEPSGLAHLPFGVYRPLLLKDMLRAGVKFKLWLADWFAWINRKMGGDLDKIKQVGNYFAEVWRAAGVPMGKVQVIMASDYMDSIEYWEKVIKIAKATTVARANRALTIMGRKEGEMKEVAQYFYPVMQVSDIFHLKADITQLGLDQRRANILAREVGPKLGWWKPVVVSHHMLMSLEGKKHPEGYDQKKVFDVQISSKMSKSKPGSCIFVHDSTEEIASKINAAFCPPNVVANNPLLDYAKEMVFRAFKNMKIERKREFGGDITVNSYGELERYFVSGELHPLDFKRAMAIYIDKMIDPIRTHFEKKGKARNLYLLIKKYQITR